jgi:ElaB/YqjD/DUF883 family membrane-anchored ribosome-binding protein
MKLEVVSFRMLETTKEKLEKAKTKMSKAIDEKNAITWDAFFDILINMYLPEIEDNLEKKIDFMKVNESETKQKLSELQEQMGKYFKEQNNNIKELIGAVNNKNNDTEILQTVQSIERQNENISLGIKSIQEFNRSVNDDYKLLINSIKELLSTIGNMSKTLSGKITQKIRRHFGIAIPILLHYIVRDNSLKLYQKTESEAIIDVNKTVSNYKNLYNSSEEYSDEDISALMDKYAMKKWIK